MRQPSELQDEILDVIASSPKLLVTNQIAKLLERDQTTIFNSVESLIEHGMLTPERQKEGIRKYLKLTDKGVCHILDKCDGDYEKILQNHQYLEPFSEVGILKRLITDPDLRREVYREIAWRVNKKGNEAFESAILVDGEYHALPTPRRERYDESDIEEMEFILSSIISSIYKTGNYGLNIEETNKFIDAIQAAHIQRLSDHRDTLTNFESLAKQGKLHKHLLEANKNLLKEVEEIAEKIEGRLPLPKQKAQSESS